jgi:sigma-B regulation protein RsbU (phosphoserine phosphatase)
LAFGSDILGAALEYMPNYSAIAVPLKAGDQRLGVLTLMHHTAGRYGSEAQAMTAAFASYAAIAIENTRLFEDAHEQVWVSTVLLQVAEATQSASDLNELLSTVVNITPLLVGVKACAIYVMDEDGRFLPAAAGGLNAENQAAFTSERFAPGDSPALDKLVGEKQPTLLRRQGEDARLSNIIAGEEEGSDVLEFLILVPLVAHGDLLGAMLVSYHNDPYKGMLQDLEAFFDERLPIIQGIAHQTAMAMENVRLMKAQREEAYVSVALLQVAQVVVSSNELDEALAAIVRITPILTGMKRVAIYLWVAESASFHLAQAYGFPRGAQIYEYCLDEFPLLEAAYTQNRLTMYPVQRAQRDWDDVPEVWTYLPAAEEDEQEDFLHNEAKLLLALPLAVKGSVMGVMLVEEPDPAPAQGLDGGNANRRMRAKRLEIATGISQQVALAIQNEQLQREQVLRERLEREMQLAREIQRTFLPQELPELPGWEIEVWWRSAREMSGDFYDFFDLPGGKLGLVIADVADKGMPAALFMTLIRTLLRAEARDSNSPAEVLAGVNALLVPDAQKGMFVTLVYGVLDPESGVLTYANAGHNPPLWVKKQAVEIESLNKSGMALGVYEGSEIDDRMIHLQPGDYLVLYTDGVTEAFSPDWTIYSADRLCSTVWEAAFGIREKTITSVEQVGAPAVSAKAMLAAIDASVEEFVGGAAPADDSTVIVLMRQGN